MRLVTHEREISEPITLEAIEMTVATLTDPGEAYVILNNGEDREERYLQAAGTIEEGFIVEYRDGGPGEHYRGDRRMSSSELALILSTYHQQGAWRSMLTWHKVRVDRNPTCA